ncbi:hypothetical protein [Sphingobium yanoikuyae]|uniref:hypothetical protein n=1 Tax=Sphingobium yanoikuyae TaxID=13690 RepID=UPI00241E794A|nr:hypothetical protein [Sphingobium yanoikuyae]
MTETEILRSQLVRRLRDAIDATVDIDAGEEMSIDVAATALTDVLAEVLVKLPAAADAEGGSIISTAMSNRLIRRMAAEMLTKGTLIDLTAAKAYAINDGAMGEGASHA